MLKRLLASVAIVSVLLACTLLVYWWRSRHGHTDQINLGSTSSSQSHFISAAGRVTVEVTSHTGGGVHDQMRFFEFKELIGYCLILPAFWLALKIRSLLPRPGGRLPLQQNRD